MGNSAIGKVGGKIRISFWNMAGLKGKGVDFWEFIRHQDYVELMETWITEDEKEDWKKTYH